MGEGEVERKIKGVYKTVLVAYGWTGAVIWLR